MIRRRENIFFRDLKGFKAAKKKSTERLTVTKENVNMMNVVVKNEVRFVYY